jgi:hypothetical protein
MVGSRGGVVQDNRFGSGTIEIEIKSPLRWVVAASPGSSSLCHSPLPNLHHCCCASLPILHRRGAAAAGRVGEIRRGAATASRVGEIHRAGPPPAVRASSAAGPPPPLCQPRGASFGANHLLRSGGGGRKEVRGIRRRA